MQPVDLTPPNFFQTWKPPVIASFFFPLLYFKVQSSVDYSSFDSVELWPETLQGNRYNNKFLFYKSTRHISLTDFILHESYFALLIKARVSMSWKEIHWQGVLFWFLIWTLAVRLKLFFLKKVQNVNSSKILCSWSTARTSYCYRQTHYSLWLVPSLEKNIYHYCLVLLSHARVMQAAFSLSPCLCRECRIYLNGDIFNKQKLFKMHKIWFWEFIWYLK